MGFAEIGCRFPKAAELREQHTKVVVSHRRLRGETDHGSKTLLCLRVAAKFAGRESLKVVKRRITGARCNGGVDQCQSVSTLATLKKSEGLVISCLNIGHLRCLFNTGGLSRSNARAVDNADPHGNKRGDRDNPADGRIRQISTLPVK